MSPTTTVPVHETESEHLLLQFRPMMLQYLVLRIQVYEQVEARRGFKAEAKAVHERGIRTVAAATSAGNTGPNAWWDKSVKPLSQPPALGESNSLSHR